MHDVTGRVFYCPHDDSFKLVAASLGCAKALRDALERKDQDALDAAVTLLFTDDCDPKFVAGALRPLLNSLTLTSDQWVDVAVGGALPGNNAIRDVALSRAGGVSAERLKRLETAIASASADERDDLESVLSKLGAKRP